MPLGCGLGCAQATMFQMQLASPSSWEVSILEESYAQYYVSTSVDASSLYQTQPVAYSSGQPCGLYQHQHYCQATYCYYVQKPIVFFLSLLANTTLMTDLLCSRLELSTYRSMSLITDCCDIRQTLKILLVSPPELALEQLFILCYKSTHCYYLIRHRALLPSDHHQCEKLVLNNCSRIICYRQAGWVSNPLSKGQAGQCVFWKSSNLFVDQK